MCCQSNSVNPSPPVSCFVKAEAAIGTICLVSSVAMLILSALQVYPILLPGYITGGGAAFLFILATVSYLCKREKEVESGSNLGKHSRLEEEIAPRNPLMMTDIVYVPPSRLSGHSVLVHPNTFEHLEEPTIRLGGAVYTAVSSATVPEGAIGMSVSQKEQLRKDLGLSSLEDAMEVVLEGFKEEGVTEFASITLEVEVEARKNKILLAESHFIANALHKELDGQVLKKGQELLIEIEGVMLRVHASRYSFTSNFGKVTDKTLFTLSSEDLNLFTKDSIPDLSDVKLEFTAFSKGLKKVTIPEEDLKKMLTKLVILPDPVPENLGWISARQFWKRGEKYTIKYHGIEIDLVLTSIKTSSEKFVSVAQIGKDPIPKNVTIKDYCNLVTIGSTEEEELLSLEAEESIETSEEELKLTVVERLEKRGVGGLPEVLNEIFQPIIEMRLGSKKKEVYEKWGFKRRKGVILDGPPGTGKTSLAKHIGGILGCRKGEIKIAKASDLLGSLVGDTERSIKQLFKAPKGSEFFVIILDEVESLISKREGHRADHEGSRVGEFLSQLDGMEKRDDFFIIGITNKLNKIDPAFLRPGRFGEPVTIGLPTEEGRAKIFEIYLSPLREEGCVAEDVDIKELVNKTDGFSGAQIEEIVNKAKQEPMKEELKSEKSVQLTMKHLTDAIN